ncbi:hypothetical protein [Duganella sp. CY15W]|uniref:hypothetical protein n=1 Tax=Duganella sp. CY15W TaxID=2692172 RepID=UPI0019294CA6|nr:hypothetical protein [Duganella sp. CY15W]
MNWLRKLALAGAAFGISWGGAIWYWRETNRMPATSELALYMLVLPLVLLTTLWLGRKAWARISVPATAGATAAATPAIDAAPEAAPLPAALIIAASAIRVPHGASVDELRAALAGNQARPNLDSELQDDDGYPVMSARLRDIDEDALRDDLEAWRGKLQLANPRFDTAQWRALDAATSAVSELAAQAASHMYVAPWLQQEHERQQGRLPPNAVPVPVPPSLQLLAVWPADWTAQQREIADQWLRTVAVQAGWPQQRLAAPAPISDADDAGPALSKLLGHCGDSKHPCLAIVIAAASHLSENSIASLSAQNGLFSATHPQGRIPGEGAAGLLLADAAHASLITGRDDSGSVLQTIASGRRSASADDAKRDTDTSLAQAAEQALHNARLDGAAVTLVTADTGHRTSRVTELMHVVTAAAPQLDPGADVISIGSSCGSCGAVTWLTALAVADAEVQDRGGPVLCISNEDPYRRYAALLRPALAA